MSPQIEVAPQRTIDLGADTPDDRHDSLPRMPAPHKKPHLSRKGIPTGAKWHFTNEQLTQLLPELRLVRDKAMVLAGAYVGFRISELFPWTLADVLELDNSIKEIVIVESKRLKGKDMAKTAAFLVHRNSATTSAYILHDGFELFQAMQVMGDAMFANVA
jgi:hypothetical protein